jgi:hypothetical protein
MIDLPPQLQNMLLLLHHLPIVIPKWWLNIEPIPTKTSFHLMEGTWAIIVPLYPTFLQQVTPLLE